MNDQSNKRIFSHSRKHESGPWLALRWAFAVMFVAAGATKLVFSPPPVLPTPAWNLLAVAELSGGLLLLVPGLAWFATSVLLAASGVLVLSSLGETRAPLPWPALVFVPALAALGFACRPEALARARLERAVDRFIESQHTSMSGGKRG